MRFGTFAAVARRRLGEDRFSVLYLVCGVVLALAYGLAGDRTAQYAIYHLLAVGMVVTLAIGIRHHKPGGARYWWLLVAGLALCGAGDFVWDAYEWLGRVTPFPSYADGLYLAGAMLSILGLFGLNRRVLHGLTQQALDGTVLAFAGAAVVFVALVGPLHDQAGAGLGGLIAAAYPSLDALLLVAVLPMAVTRPRNAALQLILAYAGFTFLADTVYGTQLLHNTYAEGGWIDVGWLLGFACVGSAALSESFARAADPLPRREDDGWAQLGLVAVALVTVVAVLAAQAPSWKGEYVVSMVLCGTTLVLVFLRVGLIHADRRATIRDLQAESDRLAAVEDVQANVTSGSVDLDALLRLVCQRVVGLLGHGALVVLLEDERLVVRAAAGCTPITPGTALQERSLAAASIAADRVMIANDTLEDERVDCATATSIGARSLMAAPLHFGGTPIGSLEAVASAAGVYGPRDARTLGLLASLLSVAVSRSSEFAARRALSELVDSSEDAIVTQSLDGQVTNWNAGAERMYGYSSDEIVGRNVETYVPDDRRDEMWAYQRQLVRGASVAPFETERVRKDGRRISVSVGLSPIRDAHGRIVGAFAIARDITQRKELEQQLHRSLKLEAVGRLAGGVAHDFNNLLLAIEGYASLLLPRLEGTEHGYVEQILAAAGRSAELTQQLLAYSRKQILKPAVVDPNEIVDEIARLLERMIGDDIVLERKLGEDIGCVLVDPSRLGQVVMNLGVNARDAMPNGGRLTIETARVELYAADAAHAGGAPPGRYVRLMLSDTGIGMDRDTLDRIFEPFFTTKAEGEGTGLGLATVFGTVSQSGGYVAVDSRRGHGTCFSVYLPEHSVLERPATQARALVDDGRGSETVLVVDDQETVRELLHEVLSSAGYHVVAARDAKTALRHVDDVDVVVTDVVMPGMSGIELARRFRTQRPGTPVVLMSGYAGDELDLADVTFLQKPYGAGDLRAAVRSALDRVATAA